MIKGPFQQEEIPFISTYAPSGGASKYVKKILPDLKGGINRNTITAGALISPLSSMDRTSKQKINKETLALNNTQAGWT